MAASAEEQEEPRTPQGARRREVAGSRAARARRPASPAPWITWRLEPVTSFRSVRRWTSEWRTSPWPPVSPDPASLHVPQLRHEVSTEPVPQPCGPEPCREPAPDSGQVGRARTEMLQDPSDPPETSPSPGWRFDSVPAPLSRIRVRSAVWRPGHMTFRLAL